MAEDLVSTLYVPDAGEPPLIATAGVSVLRSVPLARLSFRGGESAQHAAGTAFGTPLPNNPLSASCKEDRASLWLGPDEWLLLAPEEALADVSGALEKSLSEEAHALVDISHRQDAIIVTGPEAAWLLNSGIPIDLHPTAFPVGTVSRTLFHKAPVMLWRVGPETFVVEAWGSFMDYVTGLLGDAARELQTV